jgi:release factor glutamine methyltransferase
MTIHEWLFEAMKRLGAAGVDSPRRDALVLLEDTLGQGRAWVLAHPRHRLQERTLQTLDGLVEQRINREPLAYIRGKAWFWGRFFTVSPDVMIPRPESEAFIELLKQLVDSKQLTADSKITDIGTGSGCLAVTAKLELPEAEVTATDTSQKALKIARQNAQNHKTEINFLRGSLLEPLSAANCLLSAILANLPYVPEGLVTSPEIGREPAEALFSGKDGLDHYREFWIQVKNLPQKPQYILAESLADQHKEMAELANKAGYKLQKTTGLVQLYKR